MTKTVTKSVQEYYGEVLKTKEDLKTSACCPIDAMPTHLRSYMANVHQEVQSKFYGCGSPIPLALENRTMLDLGCGSGRDVYTASQLVGEKGHVIGIDMTEKQLSVGKKYIDYHMDKFGFKKPNVTFHQGYIEDLKSLGINNNSIDVVISNCVINLSPNKIEVFREVFRVLKPGGELYFSDVFSGQRVPENLMDDPILLGECLGGAMYIEDFRQMLCAVGFLDYRVVAKVSIELNDPKVQRKVGMIDFFSMTIRVFKCISQDTYKDCNYVVCYKGTITDSLHDFVLDDSHLFKRGQSKIVCSKTAKILSETRYNKHFSIEKISLS